MFGIDIPNPLKLAEKAIDTVTDTVGDIVKGGADLAGTIVKGGTHLVGDIVKLPVDLVTGIFQPKNPVTGGLVDLIKNPGLIKLPGVADGESSYQGMIDSINGLSGEIDSLKKMLENPDLTPEERMQLSFELQEKMQERMQMITMLTNLMKTEHDGVVAIANNFRV